MACYNRMERTFLQGLLWMYLLGFGFMALSLEPGFLDFDNLPDTNFTCVGKVIGGYYADLETNCQMFHVCTIGQLDEPMDIRFLCLNGTVFDQETRVCERIDEVDCTKSEQFYSLNLELYGNSQLSNLEENPETEQPLIIKSTPPSTTTPTEATPRSTSTRPAYYATPTQQRLPSHHFPVVDANSSPDIRFNPEEINVSLNAGAPPDFRTNRNRPVSKGGGTSTQRSEYGTFGGYDRVTPREVNFAFKFGGAREGEYDFQTQYKPSQQYGAPPHESSFPSSTYRGDFSSSTTAKASNYHHQVAPTTSSTTARSFYSASPVSERRSQYEEAPQRIQLPLPTLTFSTPAPFSLQRHVEQKRYTKEHLPPPRIVVSASASVSDASGRRLNYSLGTIDASPLLKQPPASYDNYKDEDVVLDPFYIDVQKLKSPRRKRRDLEETPSRYDIIKNDEDAVRVLKFLFDWYRSEKTTPLTVEGITAINDELAPEEGVGFEVKSSDVFDERSKYSLVDRGSVTRGHEEVKKVNKVEKHITFDDSAGDDFKHEEDYVNDNYEPEAYDHKYGFDEEARKFSFADEYVDDNIEPIFYRTHESYPENDTNQLEDSESTTGSLETTSGFAPTQTTRATEMPTTRKQRRGRRKFQSEATVEDEELKPHRAKDHFDHLRTVHLHASTPKTTPSGDEKESNQTTESSGDASGTLEESRQPPPEDKPLEETVVTTTESFRNTKRRRGKHKYQDETNQKKPQRRRKPPKPPEVGPAPSQKNSSSVGEETIHSALGNSSTTERNPSSMEASLEVSIEATTKPQVIKSRRGRMKFLSSAEPESSSTPAATSKQEEVLGTPTIPSFPLDDSVPNESFPQATSTTIVENSTYPYLKHLEEVYATAFVPTTDSVHLTKKKQLKENLLNSEFPTTESSLELNTIRGSDSTEDYTHSSDFWPTDTFDTTEKEAELSTETSMLTGAPVTTKFGHIFPENMSLVNIVVEEIDTTTDRGRKQELTDVPTESSEASTDSPVDSTEKPVVSTDSSVAPTETQFSPTKSQFSTEKAIDSTDSFVAPTEIQFSPTKSPVASSESAVDSTELPVASSKSAVDSTEFPVDSTEKSVVSIDLSMAQTETQFSSTKSPVASSKSAVDSTELPVASPKSAVDSTESPVDSTEKPVDSTKKPVISTDLSMDPTETQFSPTESAVGSTKSAVVSTESPVDSTEKPVDSTETPVVSTDLSLDPTETQFSPTESAVASTKSAIVSTESPVDSTEKPVDSTKKPFVSTDSSVAPTETQFSPSKSPVASSKSAVVSTKSPVASSKSAVVSTKSPVDSKEPPVASTESPVASPVASLTTSLDEETDSTQIPTTFEQTTTTTTRRPQRRRGGKPTRRRPSGYSSSSSPGHRFLSQEFTRRGKESTTSTTVVKDETEVLTEYPLRKSVNPTQAERGSGTTPLSRKASTGRKLFFNCFGKEVDKFYPDSRDCRLFHYCTRGYNENQLLDMKFVCDFNTFFDDERVICTKTKPKRCL